MLLLVSENPAISPPSLMPPFDAALLPPRVGNGVKTPFCQLNARHSALVKNEQKFSRFGSSVGISLSPETRPKSLMSYEALLSPDC